MNLVDLTLVVFVALTVFVGIKRGFLISLLSALRFIIAVPLSLFVGNNYNVIIYNKVVRRYILEYVSKKLNDSSEITKFTENVKSFAKKIRKEKELPFHKTNSFFGGVFGLVKSGAYLIVISAVCEFVLDIMTTQNQFVTQLRSSVIIEYINKFNPLI